MSRNKNEKTGKKFSVSGLFENNKVIFVLSLVIAIICWAFVSMYETPETERLIQNVKVQLTGTNELNEEYGLSVFDNSEFTVDVTVRGLSYVVNSASFTSDSISVTASCSSVTGTGTFPLTLNGTVNGFTNSVEIVKLSKNSINVYFDKEVQKEFDLTEDIQQLEGYSLAEGMILEAPVLSPNKIVISGPSRDVNKITSVKAHIELNTMLKTTEKFSAEIIPESEAGTLDVSMLTIVTEGPFYITLPLTHTGTYDADVDFTNVPEEYRNGGIDYTVTPSQIDVTVAASAGSYNIESNQITVGTVDFSQIAGETVNYIKLKNENSDETFTVTIDTTGFYVRWTSVPVDVSSAKLPDNVTVNSTEIKSVRLVGPKASLQNIGTSAVYAVPDLSGLSELKPGKHTVPAVIKFRTLKDSWVYGTYEMEITVK